MDQLSVWPDQDVGRYGADCIAGGPDPCRPGCREFPAARATYRVDHLPGPDSIVVEIQAQDVQSLVLCHRSRGVLRSAGRLDMQRPHQVAQKSRRT